MCPFEKNFEDIYHQNCHLYSRISNSKSETNGKNRTPFNWSTTIMMFKILPCITIGCYQCALILNLKKKIMGLNFVNCQKHMMSAWSTLSNYAGPKIKTSSVFQAWTQTTTATTVKQQSNVKLLHFPGLDKQIPPVGAASCLGGRC